MTDIRILDACCGSRMFWFDKFDPDSMVMEVGAIDASVLSCGDINLANKEITISFGLSKEGNRKLREALRGY